MERPDIRVRMLPAERFTPFSLARKLGARVLLESASLQQGRGRYSLLLVDEAFRVSQTREGVFLSRGEKTFRVRHQGRDLLDVLSYFARQHAPLDGGLPFPAGGVGFLSYEFCTYCDTIRLEERPDPIGLPLGAFLFGHVWVVMDHYTDRMYLVGMNYREAEVDLERALDAVERRLENLDFSFLEAPEEGRYPVEDLSGDQQWFLDAVTVIKDHIVRGNLLQAVPSRRKTLRTAVPAFEAYRILRSVNPSPYLFFLDFGSFQLFGSSPEVHVKVKDGEAVIRPIAGTRRRGRDQEEDRALEAELLADEKERAEHLMLVDLARNDLGRVCEPASVHVADLMVVERYSHVMHIVSEVRGRLREGKTGIDALRASFPAGTVTGAPKIKAMEVVSGLEPVARSFYAGVVGYLEPDGSLDTCITIRSGLKKGDMLFLQAGAGVVYDSRPEREFEETEEKLAALMHAIGLEDAHVPSHR
ncbi:anthranilate synthase component I [Spirochaeta thermophila]|uniref:Anthranilate synthase component 1 n=1 Tax=Winmispira thermophila (strain ATCC 49972 / DSM 6192 / RI 19.B1) TaxID=665571 RepID=E0RNF5_WINT6|nr:anthranilate synthase component I [Spirochaeta thermophila]ADN01155.1 anthranilate synthase component 1 [Spirochaeta thermophila DSM 6192]